MSVVTSLYFGCSMEYVIKDPQVSPLQARGFSTFLTCVWEGGRWVMLVLSVTYSNYLLSAEVYTCAANHIAVRGI